MINDFDQVKDAVNIKALVLAETGLSMKGHHLSECPFCHGHECFSIKEDEGYFNCFQCDEAGDIFSFLKKLHGIESAAALKQAAVFGNITLSQRESVVVHSGLKDQIFNEAREYYHEHFKSNGGRAYFQARGHGSEVLERMKIGWTDGKLAQYLLDKFSKEDVLSSGLAREKDGVVRDLFGQGVAVFPHQDRGRTIHFTIKDPEKKQKHQLPAKFRDKWLFYKQDVLHKYQELILVEGENDLLSVMTAGVDYVMAIIGQISEEQLKALKKYCHGKHLYLWFDNDESGRKYVRKVCDTLKNINIRIIVQPNGKDPDEYLRDITEEQKRKAIKILKEASITPVAWEIMVAGDLPGLDEKYAALKEREIFTKIGAMVEIEQHIYSDKLTKIGFKESAIQKELDLSRELLQEIGAYMAELHHMKDADPLRIARIMFAGYTRQGRFYSDRRENVYLLFQNRIYIVGNNRPFNAMVMKTTGLIPTKEPGRSVWESLASEAYNNGKEINLSSWLFTSQKQDAIYANLNSVNNIIIKVSPNKIEEIQNGLNDDSVLLKSSQKIMPFNYLPDCEVGEGFKYLGELIFNSLTCEREQRYLILCWFMSSFLIELSPYMALMKFSGESGSGKTTAAKLISCLIYGDGHLGDASTAAAYAEASQNPLLIIDNLESGDMTKSMLKFLLLVCTGGSKVKRTAGTESDTTEERPRALILLTAIEPFLKAELINRTYDIEFSKAYQSDDYVETEVIRSISKHRDLILSSVLKFLSQEILPSLKHRGEYMTILRKEYKNHSKDRTDEYLALLMVMLSKLLKHIPYYNEDHPLANTLNDETLIRKQWIEYQDSKAKATEVTSSSILKLLDGLMRDYAQGMRDKHLEHEPTLTDEQIVRYTHPEYMIEVHKTAPVTQLDDDGEPYLIYKVEFQVTSGELCQAFDRYCKNYSIKNPYSSAAIFSSRLKNDKRLLKKGGWDLISKDDSTPYFRVIRGNRYYKFRKTVIR